jgi:streptogramin lyase
VCAADGSGYEVAASCSGQQYCEDGECLGYACIAGNIWCEGEVYKVCSGDGKSVQYEEDCASSGKHCLQSGCNENVCDPGVKFCADEVTAATCFDDGTNYSTLDCGVGQFCLSGACLAWVCEPNLSWCDGSQVVTCNQWGSGYLPPAADCAASNECCVGGTCVPKAVETCDGADNDCDGEVDEGVLSACGDCDPDCGKIGLGPGSDNPFKTVGPGVFQMEPDAQGNLVVLSGAPKLKHLWVANSGEGTVTKLDTELGVEVARYKVCGDPSRTAVDLHGNVWVACRGDGGVAKIAGHPAFCVDKNGNGTVDTVQDSNGNGKFDPGEMLPSGDECVMFTTFPGGSCQRAIGVDRDNFAWVGEWSGGMLRRLSPTDGAVVDVVDIPGNPYGLVVDGAGVVWVSGRGGDILVRVDPNQNPLSVSSWGVPGGNLYGITVDLSGKVWIGQYSNGTAARFDPNTKQFNTVNIGGCPRGMAASVDGFIYSGLGCSGNEIAKINAATFQVEKLSTGQGQTPIGVALDWDGFVWAVCYSTSNAAKIDPATKQTFGPFAVGSYPYTYSDMTGYVLHHFTSPSGPRFYSDVVVAPEGVPVVWTSFAQGVVTEGAGCPEAVVTLRAGNGLAELAQQNWLTPVAQDPGQPYVFDLGGLQLVSSHFEFRVEVPSPPAGCTVKLTGVTIQYQE